MRAARQGGGADRPVVALFVGARSLRIGDMCRAASRVADVVVFTSEEILGDRADSLDEAGTWSSVVASSNDELLARALDFARATPVNGALSFSEDMVETVARFAAELGLAGQLLDAIPLLRDKFAQRQALAAAGLPVPAHATVGGLDDVDRALADVPLPGILKPRQGSGGCFTYIVLERNDLLAALRDAGVSATPASRGAHKGAGFILESLLVGGSWHAVEGLAPYVSVESGVSHGHVVHQGVTDRFPLSPPALETGLMLPSSLSPGQLEEVVAVADEALRAVRFRHGLAHTEIMLTAEGPRVIEVNGRAGGALPYLFPLASGLDLVQEATRLALGLRPTESVRFDRHALFVGPQHPVGVEVVNVHGLDAVRSLPGVRAVIPLALAGTRTVGFQHTLIAAILATAATPADAVQLWRDVMDRVEAEYVPSALAHAG